MHDNAMIANLAATTILIAGIKNWKVITDKRDAKKILVIT
jgi:hypothetical protein